MPMLRPVRLGPLVVGSKVLSSGVLNSLVSTLPVTGGGVSEDWTTEEAEASGGVGSCPSGCSGTVSGGIRVLLSDSLLMLNYEYNKNIVN